MSKVKVLEVPADLYEEMSKAYRKMDLVASMQPLVFKFLSENKNLALEEGIPEYYYSKLRLGSNNLKRDILHLCCMVFLTPKLLGGFLEYLPKDIRAILDAFMWNEQLSEDEIKRDVGVDIIKPIKKTKERYYYYKEELKPAYQFFSSKSYHTWNSDRNYKYNLFLVSTLRALLIKNSPKPKNYHLHPTTLEKTDYIYHGEKDIFLELPRLMAYYEQGYIRLTAKDRPVANSLGKIQRALELVEFFEDSKDKLIGNLRTNAIAGLLVFSRKVKYRKSHVTLIKQLFEWYRKETFLSFPRLLTHIKGVGQMYDYDLKSVESQMFEVLQEMPLDNWVTMENVVDFIRYRNLSIEPVPYYTASNRLYLVKEGSRSHKARHYIKEGLYPSAITHPLIKANFFLFAAFGLVEIAYNQPDTTEIAKTYFSPYDGLQFVRLTELGAYVIGKKQKYNPPEESKQVPLVLSPDSLMILSDERDTTADILLQNYTRKVGANRYQTDASVFLSGCTSKKQLENKIKLFSKTVSSKPPENWTAFFNELRSKINPFEEVGDKYTMLKIPPSNRELIQLIAQDSILKKLVLKGEGFHVFVEKKDLTVFKSRLMEFGFLFAQ